jgi:tripartite-type tricarboxylate transporter receptor subunit TctC
MSIKMVGLTMTRMMTNVARLLTVWIAISGIPAAAEDYPTRPIRLLVTSPAGSLVDSLARIFSQDLSDQLGQPIVIENRPGAMTQIAAEVLIRSPADGYTLMISSSESTMLPFLKKSYTLDPLKDFTPLALLVSSWTVFAVNSKLPVTTLQELIDYSKAHPGTVRYGSGGVGGALHIAGEMLKLKTGADLTHVAYRGGGQATTDAISGEIEMVSLGLASARVAEGGALRLLAQTGPRRHPLFPDVPTTAELGFPDVRMETWFGLVGPPNLPEPIARRLVRNSQVVVSRPALREKMAQIGCDIAWLPMSEFKVFIGQETEKWKRLIPALGIPPIE